MKNDKELGDKKEVKINKIKEQLARLREKLKVDNDKKESPVLKPKKIHHEKKFNFPFIMKIEFFFQQKFAIGKKVSHEENK